MNGIELSRGYYEAFGKPMLREQFPDLLDKIAIGFVGKGSEHFGFDDAVSRDHDFEPGFCIFLPGEEVVDRRSAFLLERAYAKLPKEFEGVKRQMLSPVGGNRSGVIRTADFYKDAVGSESGELSLEGWLRIPDYALAEATNGEVYFDGYGEFSRIRESLRSMPEDIRLKRLAGNLLLMAQSGQYNFMRCVKHGEFEAAQLAAGEYVQAALKVIFALNRTYMPYYKWSFRALRSLPDCEVLAAELSEILSGDIRDPEEMEHKYYTIEAVAADVIDLLQKGQLTEAICGDLEKHAYSVNDRIADGQIRNLHILAAV